MSKPFSLLAAGMLCIVSVVAQSTLTLNGTTSFTILAGTPVSMNGLVLTPAADFFIAAPNQLDKNSTLSHIVTDPYVARTYKWSNTLPAFNGTVGFYYADVELNSISESALVLQAHTGYSGFSAQQVEEAAVAVQYDFSGVHKPENEKDHYSLE